MDEQINPNLTATGSFAAIAGSDIRCGSGTATADRREWCQTSSHAPRRAGRCGRLGGSQGRTYGDLLGAMHMAMSMRFRSKQSDNLGIRNFLSDCPSREHARLTSQRQQERR